MSTALAILALLCLGVVLYTWAGYPLILEFLSAIRHPHAAEPPAADPAALPRLTVLIAAHNEAEVLPAKLRNVLEQGYPADRLEVVVASDGSTDDTVAVARAWAADDARVRVYDGPPAGKTATQNAALELATGDVVLFNNADTMLGPELLSRVARRFSDPEVGCVATRLDWVDPSGSATGAGTALYWRFEYLLWRLESRLGLLACAPGGCMAVSRSLLRPMDPAFGEDVVLPIQVAGSDARVVFAEDAVALEPVRVDAGSEFRVRTRMVVRSYAGTVAGLRALDWTRSWRVGVAIVSHKVLRWLTPYVLVVLGVASATWWATDAGWMSATLVGAQALAYAAALLGWLLDRAGLPSLGPPTWIYYFMVSVLASGLGVARAVRGRKITHFAQPSGQGIA